jgi:hypothetical protein
MNGDFVSLIEKERAILDRYSLDVWQERDRIIISFYDGEIDSGNNIFTFVDDEARDLIECGFIDMKNPFWSCYKYAKDMGLIKD